MELIHPPDAELLSFLRDYAEPQTARRALRCCYTEPTDGGVLLLNGLSKELLYLTQSEREDFFSSAYAAEHWFSVPEDLDENELVRRYRLHAAALYRQNVRPDRRWILYTTTCCNARCPYCYEIGHHRNSTMSAETAQKTASLILQQTPAGRPALLVWMGGEPLLNTRAIDTICSLMQQAGADYRSTMATNGYLITDELIQRAVTLWRLRTVQITLDGLEQDYNAIKGYTDPSAKTHSPFQRVLENIGRLLKADIQVELHLNVTESNGDDVITLIYLLLSRFGVRRNLQVKIMTYFQRVFDDIKERSTEANRRILQKQTEAQELCRKIGFWRPVTADTLKVFHCSPDRDAQYTVLPDGHVGWCDQVLDRDFLGTVFEGRFDEAVMEKYKERMEELPECAACPHYPDCIRLKCCNIDVMWCSDEIRGLKDFDQRARLRTMYENYLAKTAAGK